MQDLKSVQVEAENLKDLASFFHTNNENSSLPEYSGARNTPWIKSDTVLASSNAGKYQPGQLPENILLESEYEHFGKEKPVINEPIFSPVDLKPRSSMPDFMAISTALFLLLVTLGIGNIKLSEAKNYQPLLPPAVLGETKEVISEATPEAVPAARLPDGQGRQAKLKVTLSVKIDDGSTYVNIRQKPTVNSEKISTAKDGNTFEFVSKVPGWYEVRLTDGSTGFTSETGFISAKYIVEEIQNL